MRSRCRCSKQSAIHINSHSWLRSSSTHEPSDPPHTVVQRPLIPTEVEDRAVFIDPQHRYRHRGEATMYKCASHASPRTDDAYYAHHHVRKQHDFKMQALPYGGTNILHLSKCKNIKTQTHGEAWTRNTIQHATIVRPCTIAVPNTNSHTCIHLC